MKCGLLFHTHCSSHQGNVPSEAKNRDIGNICSNMFQEALTVSGERTTHRVAVVATLVGQRDVSVTRYSSVFPVLSSGFLKL